MEALLSLQTKEFRDGVAVVAIDPSAPYASGIRRALPQARIVLDHFLLDRVDLHTSPALLLVLDPLADVGEHLVC